MTDGIPKCNMAKYRTYNYPDLFIHNNETRYKKACTDFISCMVIIDAKSQLKLSKLSIQQIADSPNFPNISFFQ